ncbi:MAG: hypothetical protein ATN36_07805 [Epulopiscium sp. Nele67-Bin005]|nr:MAG: hypothetical protein ATN36_07805 [Epulopiscium sp. Nele67-Bin005]
MKCKQGLFLLTLVIGATPIFADSSVGTLGAKGAILVEPESKRILYSVHGEEPLPMASTTKIMTCILVLEKGNLDDIVTVSKQASQAPPVKLKLKAGEKQKLGDLLYSLMLESHNDTSVAIAEHVGGSVEEFCNMMTEMAHSIGATQSSFKTPNGLDAEGHYASPYDLAIIAGYALENPKFVEIINTPNKTIPSEALEGSYRHDLQNKNRFLSMVSGANGVKTGYTSKAGHCFVGAAKRDDMQLIGVALGNFGNSGKSRKYTDVQKMIEYGFKNFKPYVIIDNNQILDTIAVTYGKSKDVKLVAQEQLKIPLTKEEVEKVKLSITKPDAMEAPIKKDQEIGRVDIVLDGLVLGTTPLYAESDVAKMTLLERFKEYMQTL